LHVYIALCHRELSSVTIQQVAKEQSPSFTHPSPPPKKEIKDRERDRQNKKNTRLMAGAKKSPVGHYLRNVKCLSK
jgi:hypothetical protein